jgi:hypothetical protein
MLRADAPLAAVLAETHFRDAQALFETGETGYCCFSRLISGGATLDELRAKFPNPFLLDDAVLRKDVPGWWEDPAYAQSWEPRRALNPFDAPGYIGPSGIAHYACQLPGSVDELDVLFRRKWGQIAALHDAAYPIELGAKLIKSYVEETFQRIGCPMSQCPDPFGLAFNRLCDLVTLPRIQAVCEYDLNPKMFGVVQIFVTSKPTVDRLP